MDFIDIKDNGVQITIGQSPTGYGKGLFLSVSGEENVTLPDGSLVCDYGKGEFTVGKSIEQIQSDKVVAYSFDNLKTGVVFEKKFMPLLAAIDIVEQRVNNASANNDFQLADAVLGHTIRSNNDNQAIKDIISNEEVDKMEIKPKYLERCFTPFEDPGRLIAGQIG
jgi:hypothetical protein